MIRAFSAVALLLICPALCHAAEPKKPAEPTEQIIKMSLQPMAAPVPALKYQLLPTLEETNPGNPIQGYLKCFMEEGYWFNNPKMEDERERYMEIPLKDLPAKEILPQYSGTLLANIDYAARLDTPDWQCLLRMKAEGPKYFLFPMSRPFENWAGPPQSGFEPKLPCGISTMRLSLQKRCSRCRGTFVITRQSSGSWSACRSSTWRLRLLKNRLNSPGVPICIGRCLHCPLR